MALKPIGLVTAELEGTPLELVIVKEILDELRDERLVSLSGEFVVDLKARVEGLEWSPPQDQRQKLLELTVAAVRALTVLGAE